MNSRINSCRRPSTCCEHERHATPCCIVDTNNFWYKKKQNVHVPIDDPIPLKQVIVETSEEIKRTQYMDYII